MNYSFSKHAIEQLEKRNISRKIIDEIISHPDKDFKHDDCLKVFQKVIEEKENKYLYRVFVNSCKKPELVITAYKTSKIKKYENKI